MTTEVVYQFPRGNPSLGHKVEQRHVYNPDARQVFSSDASMRLGHNSEDHVLPSVGTARQKRNSDGQVLQVSFAPEVTLPTVSASRKPFVPNIQRVKGLVPGVEPVVNVDHKHYEQWARIQGRKPPNNALLRGIQALKARIKRENMEHERLEVHGNQQRELHINALSRNNMLTRDKLSDEFSHSQRKDRMKTRLPKPPSELPKQNVEFHKPVLEPRHLLKTNSRVIDSNVFKHQDEIADLEVKDTDNKHFDTTTGSKKRELQKPRTGVAKIRDRCPLPVSVYQPISIGEHVFLVNEPIKYNEYIRQRSNTDSKSKLASRSSAKLNTDTCNKTMVPVIEQELGNFISGSSQSTRVPRTKSVERSKTFPSGFFISRRETRAPVTVSSAEVFDFSYIARGLGHLLDNKSIARSTTELSTGSRVSRAYRFTPSHRR